MNKTWVKIILVLAVVAAGIGFMIYGSRNTAEKAVGDPSLRRDGKVFLVEYGDFQCPACAAAEPAVEQLLAKYEGSGKLEFEFRHFPLPSHQHAVPAANAAEIARAYGHFDEMKTALYQNQTAWTALPDATDFFAGLAEGLGIPRDTFLSELAAKKFNAKIQDELKGGVALGVNATPTFFMDGQKFVGVPAAVFTSTLEEKASALGR